MVVLTLDSTNSIRWDAFRQAWHCSKYENFRKVELITLSISKFRHFMTQHFDMQFYDLHSIYLSSATDTMTELGGSFYST